MQPVSNTPLVSIVMLTYNRAEYIAQAINSVLTQTYPHWELLIQDDGSTDDTAEIVARYRDSRIRYLPDVTNKGLAQKRFESLSYCRGTYVAILDSDDIWVDTNKLTAQVSYQNSNPTCAIVGTQINLINAGGASIGNNMYLLNDVAIRNMILVRNQFAHSSVLMRKSFLDQTTGYQKLDASEDLDLYLRLGRLGSFANLHKRWWRIVSTRKVPVLTKSKLLRAS